MYVLQILLINEFCSHTNSTYSTHRRWLVICLRWRYTINVPILMCPNNNLVLTCYILINEVNNEIHNLLQFTFTLRVFTGSANPYSSITRQICWCPTMYSCNQWIKKTFIIVIGQCRQLTIQGLLIITQITACSI